MRLTTDVYAETKSNNRKKARISVATVHEKVANQRLDYQHRISLQLTCENPAISCEDLK